MSRVDLFKMATFQRLEKEKKQQLDFTVIFQSQEVCTKKPKTLQPLKRCFLARLTGILTYF